MHPSPYKVGTTYQCCEVSVGERDPKWKIKIIAERIGEEDGEKFWDYLVLHEGCDGSEWEDEGCLDGYEAVEITAK